MLVRLPATSSRAVISLVIRQYCNYQKLFHLDKDRNVGEHDRNAEDHNKTLSVFKIQAFHSDIFRLF